MAVQKRDADLRVMRERYTLGGFDIDKLTAAQAKDLVYYLFLEIELLRGR
jgi:hypothetical protein